MTHNNDQAPIIIPAPPGLTAIDNEGKALRIVALKLTQNDEEKLAIPLYLSESGNVTTVRAKARIGLPEAWTTDDAFYLD